MLTGFLSFELRFWLRGMMLWVFFFIIGTLVFAATSTDKVTLGSSLENTFRNAPFVVQNFYSIMGVFTLMMTTAFVNSAASREFAYNTHQLLFTAPIRKRDYLLGRFLGSAAVAVIPFLGISAGILLSAVMPWNDAERWGPVVAAAHWKSILVFAIPNTLFCGAIVFTIAILTRSTATSFIGSLLLLTGYGVSEVLTQDLDNETIAALIDVEGLGVDQRRLLAFGIVGMAETTARHWLAGETTTGSADLAQQVSALAWAGLRGLRPAT